MKILITAATSVQAHQLRNRVGQHDVILGDYIELPVFMLKSANMLQLPSPESASYAHEMLTLCLDQQIDKLYAIREEEIKLLSEAKQLFAEYGIEVVSSI